jgi:hypothetical protein
LVPEFGNHSALDCAAASLAVPENLIVEGARFCEPVSMLGALPSRFRPTVDLTGTAVEVDIAGTAVVTPIPVRPPRLSIHPPGLAEQCADLIHCHPALQSTPVLQVSPLGGRRVRSDLRWLSPDQDQFTYESLEIGNPALKEIDPAKEAVRRDFLSCRDRRDGRDCQRGEQRGAHYQSHCNLLG